MAPRYARVGSDVEEARREAKMERRRAKFSAAQEERQARERRAAGFEAGRARPSPPQGPRGCAAALARVRLKWRAMLGRRAYTSSSALPTANAHGF